MKQDSKSNNLSKSIDFLTTHFVALSGYIFFTVCCKGEIFNSKEINATLEKYDRFIIAMNHESYLDWIIIWAIFKYKYRTDVIFLAKEKLFTHRFWGKIMRHSNCIRVSDEGSKIIEEDGKKRLKESIIGIFPEGTRSRDGKLLNFKSGVAVMAAKQNIPILPISLNGFFESWQPNSKFPKMSKMVIVVNQLIENDIDYSIRDYLTETRNKISIGKEIFNLNVMNIKTAVFDLDSSLLNTSIADLLFFMNKKRMSSIRYLFWILKIMPLVPFLKVVDYFYRPLTQLLIFNMYSTYSEAEIKKDCEEYMDLNFNSKLIDKTYKLMEMLKENEFEIYILSTNQEIFVNSVSERLSAKGFGISLKLLKKMTISEKLYYLQQFKKNTISCKGLKKYIGFGDSKYDLPIFKNSSYSVLINHKKRRNKLARYVNNYIKI